MVSLSFNSTAHGVKHYEAEALSSLTIESLMTFKFSWMFLPFADNCFDFPRPLKQSASV